MIIAMVIIVLLRSLVNHDYIHIAFFLPALVAFKKYNLENLDLNYKF